MQEVILRNGLKLVIRKTNIQDAEKIVSYTKIVAGESNNLTFGREDFSLTLEDVETNIKNSCLHENCLSLVAEVDGQIVGLLNFRGGSPKNPRLYHVGEFGVSVKQEFWNLGIGTLLVITLLEWAKDNKIIRKINLRVKADNHNAIKLYKRLGFVVEGRLTREFLIDGLFHDALIMGLSID